MDDTEHHDDFPPLTIDQIRELAAAIEKSLEATSRGWISRTSC